MTTTYANVADTSETINAGELSLEQLDAVVGGNRLVDIVAGYFFGKLVDAAVEALQDAGPAPATEHGDIYTVQPAGFVG
jgi:hypothetical protein